MFQLVSIQDHLNKSLLQCVPDIFLSDLNLDNIYVRDDIRINEIS